MKEENEKYKKEIEENNKNEELEKLKINYEELNNNYNILTKENSIQSAKMKEIEKKESTISDIDKEKLSTKILPKLTESPKIKKKWDVLVK